MKTKLLIGWTVTLLSAGTVVSCGDDEGDDEGQPSAGKAAAGTAGSGSAGKSGSSGSGGKAGSAGSSSGASGTGAGTGGKAGSGGGGEGGGAGTSSSGNGGAGGEAGGGGGEGGDGGEAALGGNGGQSGEAGQGGETSGNGGTAGTAGGGTSGGGSGGGGNGGTSGGGTSGTAGGGTSGTGAEAGFGGEGGGSGVATALLRLNELNSNITNGADLIELRVIEAGDIAGITIEQVLTTPVVLATLPSLVVAANDLIVVHLNAPGGVTNEMLTKEQCGGQACFDEAWDVRGEDTGLFFGNRVISVMDGATHQDAVPFIVDGNEPPAFLDALTAIQDAGQWLPANCGGADCTYETAPTADGISVDWSDLETTAAGDSIQVTGANNNQESAWDLAASTWGEPND
jgi:hypothetical protein